MICPYCQTENRDDRETCYYCDKDLSMLRLIVNKAKHHYNQALEYAERGHLDDAIFELKNALDLDSSMVSAQLVLGTLYAQKEMFAEARESWQRALALNHHCEKAHEYLHKAEKAEYIFPAMKRLKLVSAALGGGLLIALIVVILLSAAALRPSPGLPEARQAIALLKTGDPAQISAALRFSAELEQKKDALPLVREMATDLKAAIQNVQASAQQSQARAQQEMQERITLAFNAIGAAGSYAALQISESLREKNPSDAIRQSIRRLHDRAIQQIIRSVNESADAFNAGTFPYEKFKTEAQLFLNLVTSGPEHDAVAMRLEQATQTHHDRLLAEATTAITEAPLPEAVHKLIDWAALYPDFRPHLQGLLVQRLVAESSRLHGDITALLAQGQFDRARQKLEELNLLYRSTQQPEPTDLLAQLKTEIDEAQRRAALTVAQDAYTKKNWEEFIKLTADPARLTGDKIEQDKLAGMRAEASRAFASQMWDWFQKRDDKFESGRISPEEAARAVQTHAAVLESLPGDLAYARAPILYYTALACLKLGETAQARELLDQVRQKYPKSFVIKGVTRQLKRLDDAKNPPPPAPKPAQKAAPKANKTAPKTDKAGPKVKKTDKTGQKAAPKPAQKSESQAG